MTDKASDKKRKLPSIHIRWAVRRDMPEVLQIEQKSFECAWTEEDFLRCLRQRNNIGMVAEQDGKIVGYMMYELHKNKLHMLNFAVDPNYRRCGIGKQMVEKLFENLSPHKRTRISLETRETNLPAQLFFKEMGFKAEKIVKNLYVDTGEDAYLMGYRLDNTATEIENILENNRLSQYFRERQDKGKGWQRE